MVAQATTLPPVWPRAHLDDYLKYGYVPNDKDGIGTALTLEYAIDDDAIAQLARALGDTSADRALLARASFWRNLLDPSTKFLRPRGRVNGSWVMVQPSLARALFTASWWRSRCGMLALYHGRACGAC